VKGLQLDNGEELWKSKPLSPDEATISGQGCFANDSYYLPTTSLEVVQVKLDNGTIVRRMREGLGDYDRVGKNMRFFDPIDPRPKKPPVPAVRKRKPTLPTPNNEGSTR